MKRLLLRLLGWKIKCDFPAVDKSVFVVAPHTSYLDGYIGYLALECLHINYTVLADASLFHFPMTIAMRVLHALPVNVRGKDAIHDSANLLRNSRRCHLVICPEGQLAPTDRWKSGFYHIARLARVPIVPIELDYKNKEMSFKQIITDLSDEQAVFASLRKQYEGAHPRYPEKFLLPRLQSSGPGR